MSSAVSFLCHICFDVFHILLCFRLILFQFLGMFSFSSSSYCHSSFSFSSSYYSSSLFLSFPISSSFHFWLFSLLFILLSSLHSFPLSPASGGGGCQTKSQCHCGIEDNYGAISGSETTFRYHWTLLRNIEPLHIPPWLPSTLQSSPNTFPASPSSSSNSPFPLFSSSMLSQSLLLFYLSFLHENSAAFHFTYSFLS